MEWYEEFSRSLVKARAIEQGTSMKKVRKNMRRIKYQRHLGHQARTIRQKNSKMRVTSATATDSQTGETIHLDDQHSMVKAMADSN